MEMQKQTFSVGKGKAAKRLTAVVFAITVLVALLPLLPGMRLSDLIISAAVLVACIVVSYGYSPRQITLDGKSLTIVRGIGRKSIPLGGIVSAERYHGMDTDWRTFGIGGLFGFTGWFSGKHRNDYFGYFAYVGDTKNTVLVVTRKRKYVVSCDRPDELAEALRQAIGRA